MTAAAPPPARASASAPKKSSPTAALREKSRGTVPSRPPIARPPARDTPTPKLVRTWLVCTMLAVLAFTIVGVGTLVSARTTLAAAAGSIDQLNRVENIRTNVLRADAGATHMFLGASDADYRDALAEAREAVIAAAHGNPEDAAVLQDVNRELDVYAAHLEEARVGQGTPAGLAALNAAADHLRTVVLPSLTTLVEGNSTRVVQQTTGPPSSPVVILGLVALVGLIGTSVTVGIRFRRVLNPGLAVALVLVGGAFALALATLTQARTQVAGAADNELAVFTAAAAARGSAYNARAQEGMALIDQETSSDDPWTAAARETAEALGSIPDPLADDLEDAWDGYVTAHQEVRAAVSDGRWEEARQHAVGTAPETAGGRFTVFDTAVTDTMAGAGTEARVLVDRPRGGLIGSAIGVGVFGSAAIACSLLGVRPRLQEYA